MQRRLQVLPGLRQARLRGAAPMIAVRWILAIGAIVATSSTYWWLMIRVRIGTQGRPAWIALK